MRKSNPRFIPSIPRRLGWAGALTLALATLSLGCDDKGPSSAEASTAALAWEGVVEQRAEGNVEWMMAEDGRFHARITDSSGAKVPASEVEGTVKVEGGEEKKLESKDEALTTVLPPPKEDVTELAYTFKVRGETWSGLIHVPKGGTAALLEKPAAKIEPGTRGPHGGIVDVVGDQRIELLIDEATDEVRVYFLDAALEPKEVGDAKMTVALVESARSHLKVKVAPAPDGTHLVGKAPKKIEAAERITVVLEKKGKHHARVVGMGAARVVHAGKGAPTKIRVTLPEQAEGEDKEIVPGEGEDAVDAAEDEVEEAKGKADKGVGVEAKGGVEAKVDGKGPSVDLPDQAQGKGKAGAGVGVKVP